MAAMLLAAAGAALGAYRLMKGPNAPSRAVSLDVLTVITLPLIVGLAVHTERAILIDVAFVYALLSFLGVMSLARYFDRGL